MDAKKVISSLNVIPEKKELEWLKKEAGIFIDKLKEALKKEEIAAEVFVGGSFAKGTLVRKDCYDIDIFVRFDWRYDNITALLSRAVKRAGKNFGEIKRLHGSRDYFQIERGQGLVFEIVPVIKIRRPKEARNVTDLSYFHVRYVKGMILKNKDLARQVALAKTFCRACEVYGAESYIQGFSGYALECLIIHYGTFVKMLQSLVKAKERLVIDPAEHYKNKEQVVFMMNESKMQGPIVLVDPTWRERNVLAALSNQTFERFQRAVSMFLKKPSIHAFFPASFDPISLRAAALGANAELLHLRFTTNRQAGDIAGTKLKKFSEFLSQKSLEAFELFRKEFHYDDSQSADAWYVLKPKKEIIKRGPPASMKKHAGIFRSKNKKVYLQEGRLFAKGTPPSSAKLFFQQWKQENKEQIEQMEIKDIEIL